MAPPPTRAPPGAEGRLLRPGAAAAAPAAALTSTPALPGPAPPRCRSHKARGAAARPRRARRRSLLPPRALRAPAPERGHGTGTERGRARHHSAGTLRTQPRLRSPGMLGVPGYHGLDPSRQRAPAPQRAKRVLGCIQSTAGCRMRGCCPSAQHPKHCGQQNEGMLPLSSASRALWAAGNGGDAAPLLW